MSDLKTPKQILKDRNIKVGELEQDKPMLLNNILGAMDDFADQYYNWKLANDANASDSGLHLQRVSNSVFCSYPKKMGTCAHPIDDDCEGCTWLIKK